MNRITILFYKYYANVHLLIQLVIGVQWLVSKPAEAMLQEAADTAVSAVLKEVNLTTIAPSLTLKAVSSSYIG